MVIDGPAPPEQPNVHGARRQLQVDDPRHQAARAAASSTAGWTTRSTSEFPGFGGMLQVSPRYNQPSTEKTEIWVMFDGDNIYVAASCWDNAPPEKWIANELRRDTNQMRQNDHFGVGFDTFYDRRSGFMFYANPLGGFADYSVDRRGRAQHRLEPGVGREDRPVRRRLDAGDAVPVQVAALHLRRRPGVGHPVPPLDPPQERVDLLDAGAAEHGRAAGAQSRVGVRHGGRPRSAAGRPQPRDQAVRARQDDHRSAHQSADLERQATATSAATSSTASPRTSPPTSRSTPTSRRSRSTSSRST